MRWAFMVLLLGCLGCGQEYTYAIAAHRDPCMGEGPQLCLRVDKGEGEQLHYSGIRDFDFVWGVEVEARVRETAVANPPADGSSIRYTLVKTLDTREVAPGTEFVWTLPESFVRPDWGLVWIDVAAGTLLDGTPFGCASADACAAVQTAHEEGTGMRVTFAFADGGGIELVAMESSP